MISEESLKDHRDMMAQTQSRLIDGYVARERTKLAAICGDYVAWMMYPPTPHDDPAQWAPYWARLSDVVTDDDEREAIVAGWLASHL
jgi:hypothetical protein